VVENRVHWSACEHDNKTLGFKKLWDLVSSWSTATVLRNNLFRVVTLLINLDCSKEQTTSLVLWSRISSRSSWYLTQSRNFPNFLTTNIHYLVQNSQRCVSILKRIKSVYALPSSFFMIYVIIILASRPRFFKASLRFSFPKQKLYAFLFSPYLPHAPPMSSSLIWTR
jgi:hypothetical protein